MMFDGMSIMAYAVGLVMIYFICRLFIKPLKWALKLLLNGVIGGLILVTINLIGGFAGMSIIINPLTSLLAGFLGVPGIALIIILQYLM